MKLDVVSLLAGKKADATARMGKLTPGFESALRAQVDAPAPRGEAAARTDEKKPRSISGTEEALLVARTLQAPSRSAPLFVTKQPDLKAAPETAKVAAAAKAPVTLDQLAARVKLQHEPLRVTAPTEKKPARGEATVREQALEAAPHEKKKVEDPVLATTSQAPQPAAAEPFRIDAPAPVQEARPLAPVAPLLLEDPSARVVLMPTIARMSVDTGEAGQLNVQLKVRDGITELTATGPAAPLLEARQGELRVALAKEGLALGHFDLTQHGSQHRHAERRDPDAAITPANVRRSSPTSQDVATEDGRVHVKA